MLASITPLGERGRGRRWSTTAAAYTVASALGGALVGALFGEAGALLSGLSPGHRVLLLLAAAVILAAAALDAVQVRLPSPRRQVNEVWLTTYRGWVYGSGYGLQLGAGVLTIVTTASVYAALALAGLAGVQSGTARDGVLVGLAFGLFRALPVLAVARIDGPAQLRRFHARMQSAAGWAAGGTVALLVAAAAAAAVVA